MKQEGMQYVDYEKDMDNIFINNRNDATSMTAFTQGQHRHHHSPPDQESLEDCEDANEDLLVIRTIMEYNYHLMVA